MSSSDPHLYLDTNVILDFIYSRKLSSTQLLAQIRANNWKCSTSSFAVLEMLDVQQEEKYVNNKHLKGYTLSQILHKLHERHSKNGLTKQQLINVYEEMHDSITQLQDCITFLYPHDSLWDDAERLLRVTNIGAVDSIHLATAIAIHSDIIVSQDSYFRSIANDYIPSVVPEKVKDQVAKL